MVIYNYIWKMENKQEQQKTTCPYCKSEEVVKRGTFETEAHGKQQRFFCKMQF